jgi:hypothetical protein
VSASITDSGNTATYRPVLVLDYAASRPSRNIFNTVLGKAAQDVILLPGGLRSGTFACLFVDNATAAAFLAFMSAATTFTFTDNGIATITFAVSGDVAFAADSQESTFRTVTVPYQEVSA